MSQQGNLSSLQTDTAETAAAQWMEVMKQDVKDFKEGKLNQLPLLFVLEKCCRIALKWGPRRALRVRETVLMLKDEIAQVDPKGLQWGTAEERRSDARKRAALLVAFALSHYPSLLDGVMDPWEREMPACPELLCSPCEVCCKLTGCWCEACDDFDAAICIECDMDHFQVCRECVKKNRCNPRPRGLDFREYIRERFADPATVDHHRPAQAPAEDPRPELLPNDPACPIS